MTQFKPELFSYSGESVFGHGMDFFLHLLDYSHCSRPYLSQHSAAAKSIPLQVTIYHAFLIVRPNAPGRKLQFKVTCSLISHILIQFMHMHWEKWLWPPMAQSATSKLVGKSSAFNIYRIYSPRLQGGKEALKKIYISKNQRNNLK